MRVEGLFVFRHHQQKRDQTREVLKEIKERDFIEEVVVFDRELWRSMPINISNLWVSYYVMVEVMSIYLYSFTF